MEMLVKYLGKALESCLVPTSLKIRYTLRKERFPRHVGYDLKEET